MMDNSTIKAIERKLNELAQDNETYTGGVLDNRYRAYAQGIAFTLEQIGYRVEWDNGTAHIVKE